MKSGISLTISRPHGDFCPRGSGRRRAIAGLAGLLSLGLAACTVDVGPPPESDPPLVPQSARPAPPPQPSEPQAWSRDLDLDSGPTKIDPDVLADGLVAATPETTYSEQRLTYESALSDERPPTEAELALERARARAEAAGVIPPRAAAAPVEEVSSQALPPLGAAPAAAEARQSRLPPPPKMPPPAGAPVAPAAASTEPAAATERAVAAEPQTTALAAEPQTAALQGPAITEAAEAMSEPAAAPVADAATADFLAEAWDAPEGTILVQVSAVEDGGKVVDEWHRLQNSYPQVLKPLRLVVEEARLGERGVFFRVQGGAFGSKASASDACEALVAVGQACFVVVR